jgi:hypothetical protein
MKTNPMTKSPGGSSNDGTTSSDWTFRKNKAKKENKRGKNTETNLALNQVSTGIGD